MDFSIYIFLALLVTIFPIQSIDISKCNLPLGLEDGRIKDSQLTASSSLSSFPGTNARLNGKSAWCAKGDSKPTLTIDLGEVQSISGIKTQGFGSSPTASFRVSVSISGTKYFSFNESGSAKVFIGSSEPSAVIPNSFQHALVARYIKIFPQGLNGADVCLRTEIIGCKEVSAPKVELQEKGPATVGMANSFECAVKGQVGVNVQWLNSTGGQVPKDQAVYVPQQKSEMLQTRVSLLLLSNVSVTNLLDGVDGFQCVNGKQYMLCSTVYQCVAKYPFEKSLRVTKNITVTYSLEYPKLPTNVQVATAAGNCRLSFQSGNLGSFPMGHIEYKIEENITEALTRVQANPTIVRQFRNPKPYTLYSFYITVSIKVNRWDSAKAVKTFYSFTEVPKVSPVITSVSAFGDKELKILWDKPKYEPGNGYVSRYRLDIVQFSYGGKKLPFEGMLPIRKSIDNLTAEWQLAVVDELRPWSTYNITIFAYNNDGLFDPKGFTKSADTGVGVPSGAPRNLKSGDIGSRSVFLSWEKPPFLQLNGEVTNYYAAVTLLSKKSGKKRRNVGGFVKIAGTSHRFIDLLPYRTYSIKIAAATASGTGKFSAPIVRTTNQGAPSNPQNVRLSRDPQSQTWIVFWDPPKEENGIISLYSLEVESNGKRHQYSVKGLITSLDTKMEIKYSIRLRIRARTIEFGDWTIWIDRAPRPFVPTPPPPKGPTGGGGDDNQTGIIIGCIFLVLIFLVLMLMIGFFIFYRRRFKQMARKVEVQMDKILKPPYDNPEGKGEYEHLVRSDSIDRNTDNTGSIEDKAHPVIKAEDFFDYVKKMKENEDERFLYEYKHELMAGKRYSCEAATRPENKSKNRYANITAYDHSRVILKLDSNKRKNETDYFNGNTVQGYSEESQTRYIACHGPTESVTSDFWRMIWQEGSNVIVMLTKLEEGRKVKCFQYWPAIGSLKFGQLTVTLLSTDQTADYFIRTMELTRGNETRTVRQFHFVSWPDHGVPEFPTSLLSLRRRVRHYHDLSTPMIVHCSAGVGRTGCFILIDAMLDRIDHDGKVDLFNYLQYMRTRRINMVQTLDQYIFAHDAVLEYILCGNTEVSVSDLERRIKELKRGSGMEEEFMIVESTSPDPDALGNIYKVLLRAGKFVDASYVDGYKQRDAFILCRSPTEDFVEDFWRVIKERKVHTIVMLNQLEENPKFSKYWPNLHDVQEVGPFRVCLTSEARNGNIMSRKLKLEDAIDPEPYEVQHFQFLDWPDQGVPSRRNSLLTLMSLVEKSQQQYGNGPILVHCSNGHGRSGTFAAVYNTTERLKVEQLIDVVQCVRAIRIMVPNAVDNFEQYQFIYNMIRTFLEAFATYSNFER